mmetsp:Transcript_9172/g.24854  ORF Transcript_9172/g.24854 Transcript_9172/m.24854 type:complete len:150 (-) Transcript_9172:25-474(-)
MGAETTLVPGRFITTMAQLLGTIVVFFSRFENMRTALRNADLYFADQASLDAAVQTMNVSILVAITFSMVFLIVELVGLIGGFSIFNHGLNLLYIVMHTLGSIFVGMFILEEWHYVRFWYLFAFFCLPTAILEIVVIGSYACCKKPLRV